MNFKYIRQLADRRSIILGSGSPRRYALLKETGISFNQKTPSTEENIKPGEHPYQYARRLAEEKAVAVSRLVRPDEIVIGADTVVLIDKEILGKPADEDEAFQTLMYLSGKKHEVCTALALAEKGQVLASAYEITEVYFNFLSPEKIKEYISTGEPMDKAGAYGIQGIGAFLVDRIKGNLDNVIGFPCNLLERLAGETIDKLQLFD
ncbi:MAG: Maf family protein [candidate division Zixibacteria bacterium]|nr:Maf family protein [candidate division Zixibacteria bacterium]MDD5424859.1 Maf family protein [candidate division Zixibacteria bacterium]